jgi:sporulation protein YlmC with PRC-barrel domain
MRKIVVIMAVSSLMGLGLALEGDAQTRPAPPADRPATDQPRTSAPRETFKNTQGLYESSTLVGARVKGTDGKDLGEIDQLLVDPKDGKVTHAVIGVGGLLGIGEKHVIVPWSEVRMSSTNPTDRAARPVITMDQSMLERAPRYEKRAYQDGDRTSPSASPRGTDRPATTPRSTDRPATTPPPTR